MRRKSGKWEPKLGVPDLTNLLGGSDHAEIMHGDVKYSPSLFKKHIIYKKHITFLFEKKEVTEFSWKRGENVVLIYVISIHFSPLSIIINPLKNVINIYKYMNI